MKDTWIDTYSSYYSSETVEEITSSWHDPRRLSEEIKNNNCYFAVAKNDIGKIVGIVTAQRLENKIFQIDRLYIHPDFQRQGIVKQLLDRALNTLEVIKTIILDVEAMNKKAIEFYESHGFKKYDECEEIIGDKNFKVISMKKFILWVPF